MRTVLTVFGVLFAINYCFSFQEFISISGKVLDRQMKEPLPNATIGIKGRYIGTVANEQGEYDLHVPAGFANDTLYVSMVGYSTFSTSIKDIDINGMFIVRLDQRPTVLTEVVVLAGLTPQEKMRLCFKNVSRNYPAQPFMVEGFYRETRKVNGTYVSLIEAAVELYDKNAYKNPRIKRTHPMNQIDEEVVIKQIRQSFNFFKQELEGQIGLHNNLLAYLLTQNPMKYPTRIPDSDNLSDSIVYLNDKITFEITEKISSGESRFYLDSDNYGVLEFSDIRKGQYHERRISDSVSLQHHDLIKIVKFRDVNGLLFPQYHKTSWKVEKVDAITNAILLTVEVGLELLVNRIHVDKLSPPIRKEEMKIYSLQWQGAKYDPDFWKNYNILRDTPLHEAIRKDLEKEITLEQQFKSNQVTRPSRN